MVHADGGDPAVSAPSAAMLIADAAISLFLEYRDVHGYEEDRARAAAVVEIGEGAAVDLAALQREMVAAPNAPLPDDLPY